MSEQTIPRMSHPSESESPVFRRAATARRLDSLFRAMASDYLLREQFVTDPTQIMSEYVYGTSLSSGIASVSNQLLYSLMANRRLRSWIGEYASEHRGHPPSHHEFLSDFSRVVAKYGDHHTVSALVRSSIDKEGSAGFESFERIVLDLLTILIPRGENAPTGGPPTGGPPTGGPPTGGPPTGGPPTGGPPTGGPPTGGPPTGGGAFKNLQDYVELVLNEIAQFATQLGETGALNIY